MGSNVFYQGIVYLLPENEFHLTADSTQLAVYLFMHMPSLSKTSVTETQKHAF